MKSPYLLYQRENVWYVRFESEKTFHSTGHTDRGDEEKYAQEKLKELAGKRGPEAILKDYACDFFKWDSCRWVARQRAKKRPFTKAVAENSRGQLKKPHLPGIRPPETQRLNRSRDRRLAGVVTAGESNEEPHPLHLFGGSSSSLGALSPEVFAGRFLPGLFPEERTS